MSKVQGQAHQAIEDDLNIPKLIAALFAFATILNSAMDQERNIPRAAALALFHEYDKLLAVDLFRKKIAIPAEIQELAEQRQNARKKRNFAEADHLRNEIHAHGWLVKDTPEGTKIHRKES